MEGTNKEMKDRVVGEDAVGDVHVVVTTEPDGTTLRVIVRALTIDTLY